MTEMSVAGAVQSISDAQLRGLITPRALRPFSHQACASRQLLASCSFRRSSLPSWWCRRSEPRSMIRLERPMLSTPSSTPMRVRTTPRSSSAACLIRAHCPTPAPRASFYRIATLERRSASHAARRLPSISRPTGLRDSQFTISLSLIR